MEGKEVPRPPEKKRGLGINSWWSLNKAITQGQCTGITSCLIRVLAHPSHPTGDLSVQDLEWLAVNAGHLGWTMALPMNKGPLKGGQRQSTLHWSLASHHWRP